MNGVWWDEAARFKPIPLPPVPEPIDPSALEIIVRCEVREYMLLREALEAFKGCEILIPLPPHAEKQFVFGLDWTV